MPQYEIRLLGCDQNASPIILERSHEDDKAANGVASRLARGAAFEVWRDLDYICVRRAAETFFRRWERSGHYHGRRSGGRRCCIQRHEFWTNVHYRLGGTHTIVIVPKEDDDC